MNLTREKFKTKERELLSKGYALFRNCLYGNEDFGYFKTFRNDEGETYMQIEFAFWNMEKYSSRDHCCEEHPYAMECIAMFGGSRFRIDLTITSPEFETIDEYEAIASEINGTITRHTAKYNG